MTDRTQIETEGYRKLIADHCELADRVAQMAIADHCVADRVAQMEERIALLEYLLSEEVMGSLVTPAELRAAVAEIKLSPSTATQNQTFTWLDGDVWSQYCAAVDGPEHLYTPGYPQED
jgi:hypothetical protein